MVLVVLLLVSPALAFNLDTDFPIIYRDPRTEGSSYFGYSAILHSGPEPWIQIGAPRASGPGKFKAPGRVFRCGIFGPCSTLNVVANAVTAAYQETLYDKRDLAWLGGAMDIDERSGRFAISSHRWINNLVQDYWMLGASYWSDINSTKYQQIVPLSDSRSGVVKDQNVFVYYYGQGQAGFSTHFSNSKTGPELLLGAPGVYNWGGTTIIYRDSSASYPQASRTTSRQTRAILPNEFADRNVPNARKTVETAAFGLFGYSVTSGHFFKENELLYVSGAPRSKLCLGQILVFTFASVSNEGLLVRDSRQGYQLGEYFGAALAAGDLNDDGLDDLIVGSPSYTNGKYNEGRIFVFLGNSKGSLEAPLQNTIEGREIGGQFGSCIMFMGDIHMDGYSDVAVSAPYEDDGSGAVYIYRGNAHGLDSQPSQRIIGKTFVPTIRAFGISLSRPTDIDGNYYKDLAVGAYLSGHVVLLRSRPVVTLRQALMSTTPRLEHNSKSFDVKACFWYEGRRAPQSISITRSVKVDELLQRAYLAPGTAATERVALSLNGTVCQDISVLLKGNLTDFTTPVVVEVTQDLDAQETAPLAVEVSSVVNGTDLFCSTCPVANPYHSARTKTLELTFSLGCGNDNVCHTKLTFESRFHNISGDKYVLGSTNYLTLETTITNKGENAYLTQLKVELPNSVHFRSTPAYCLEQNSSAIIICNVENPLVENKQKSLTLDLDMKEVNIEKYGEKLNFTFTVLTSSENMNKEGFSRTLHVTQEADLGLSGKSSKYSNFFGINATYEKPNFTQVYQVNKFGVSPIEEVLLTIAIPTHVNGKHFLQLYPPEGYLAGQPIQCQSEVEYIIKEDMSENAANSVENSIGDSVPAFTEKTPVKRSLSGAQINSIVKRSAPSEQDKDSLNDEIGYPSNRTFYINCSNSEFDCSYVHCLVGPFRTTKYSAMLHIKMLLDLPVIAEMLGNKDIIVVSTDGSLDITNPRNFIQSGSEPDTARVSTLFVGEVPEKVPLDLWIYIAAAVAGILVLFLIIMGLTKAGFFQRKRKEELEALKAQGENNYCVSY